MSDDPTKERDVDPAETERSDPDTPDRPEDDTGLGPGDPMKPTDTGPDEAHDRGETRPETNDSTRTPAETSPAETDPGGGGPNENRRGTGRARRRPSGPLGISAIVGILGLWIAISPFVYETTATATWNNLIVGLAILIVAAYNVYRLEYQALPTSVGAMSLAAILGLWAIVAPFVIDFIAEGLLWSGVITGLLVAILSGYTAYTSRERRAPAPAAEAR